MATAQVGGAFDRIAQFELAWSEAGEQILSFLREIEGRSITPSRDIESMFDEVRTAFDFQKPLLPDEAIRRAAEIMKDWSVHTPHPRYFGLYNPDVIPVSISADALVAGFNPQLASYYHGPGPIAMEAHVLSIFQDLLGHENESRFANFTGGGAEANHSALLCALTHAFPTFGEKGARSLPKNPVLYVSKEAHHSFVKAAHACGIGRSAVREVDVDGKLRMDPQRLSERIESDRARGEAPFFVAATGGTTAAGVIDPLDEIADVCAEQNVWMHADAAWGGAALLSKQLSPHLNGIGRAQSVTIDAHKYFSVPMGAGMFFCRDRKSVEETFAVDTSYMQMRPGMPSPFCSTMQWSRRFIGLKFFLAMATLGIQGYAKIIEHQAAMGDLLRKELEEKGWLIVNETPLPLVNFTHSLIEEHDVCLSDVLALAERRGQAWVSDVRLSNGVHAFRACISNYRTSGEDVQSLVKELNECLEIAAAG